MVVDMLELLAGTMRLIVVNSHLDLLQHVEEIGIVDKGRVAYKDSCQHLSSDEPYLCLLPKHKDNARANCQAERGADAHARAVAYCFGDGTGLMSARA